MYEEKHAIDWTNIRISVTLKVTENRRKGADHIRKSVLFMILLLSTGMLASCGKIEGATTETVENQASQENDREDTSSEEDTGTYRMISMEEAGSIFEAPGDYLILDVRTAAEFEEGHIPGAKNVANEEIGTEPLAELPDLDQEIYVYCRSGNRSRQAAEKLADMGYTNIIECGGIIDWTGEIETGAGDEAAEEEGNSGDDTMEAERLYVTVNETTLTAVLEDNSSAEALTEKLREGDVVVEMHDYGNFEKVGGLGFDLPRNDQQYTTKPGDIILYQGSNLVFYYDTNSWSFTKLGEFEDVTQSELRELFGSDGITAVISLNP